MSRNILAPSILSADFLMLGEAIQACVDASVDWFQLDVMDGHYVPNISFGPLVVEACRRATDAFIDVHLMISEPDRYLDMFAQAGANSMTVHVEASTHIHHTLSHIHDLGLKAGVALNPGTPVGVLENVIDLVDLVLVMTVNPGFAGQSFISNSPQKIRQVRNFLDERGSSAHLQVDGGITVDTARYAAEAGANVFVAASAIFQHPEGIAVGVQALQEAIRVREG
ncbi:MAG: ribulose-phosphate 3-epimerase [Anaerolineales bacterium]|nr:MAG: ribulose-phosphate 3-epimerase [Anaerolineales bacterium]